MQPSTKRKRKTGIKTHNDQATMKSCLSQVTSAGRCESADAGKMAVSTLPRLNIAGSFWDTYNKQLGSRTNESDSSGDEEDTAKQLKTLAGRTASRAELRARADAEEQRLFELERARMDPSRPPETCEDYEQLVAKQPDDSSLWIRYMAYHLQATEIEKARAVARRALKTIHFRQEREKLNLYVAWLNLESMHGTQETLNNLLHDAVQANDPLQVYTRMAEIHTANNKHDEAEQMYGRLVRKMPGSKEAWLRYGVFLMQAARCDQARALMQRALRCLDKREHVEVISKFAQLEFRFGEPERGKTMFDHLLASYPKRLDQWNVYISQLIKAGDHDAVRLVFDRLVTVRLSVHRMRSVFKRYLEFEESHGDEERVQAVREMALKYVEARSDLASSGVS